MDPSFDAVVVDANAIITSGPTSLAGLARRYYTVSEALLEVRDARARQVLAMLPFEIVSRAPCESSIEAVRAFARKTGDLARLSRTDLLLLALTHQLEKEANGDTHLRSEPLKVPTQAGLHHKREVPACKFFRSASGCRSGLSCRFNHDLPAASSEGLLPAVEESLSPTTLSVQEKAIREDSSSTIVTDSASDRVVELVSRLQLSNDSSGGAVIGDAIRGGLQVASVQSSALMSPTHTVSVSGAAVIPATDAAKFAVHTLAAVDGVLVADDDGDGDWIAPSPPAAKDSAVSVTDTRVVGGGRSAQARTSVVCITSDFAMQNVLLQMGLALASAQGKLIREVKTWVLKCDACFNITDKMDKLFCPTCGNATLARLGVSIAADGAPSYHYRKHRDFNTRGTVFALPTPQGGRSGGGLLLREDQLLMGKWAQKARERVVQEPMFGDRDAAPVGVGPAKPTATSQVAEIVVGYGRTNPNATRHRT